MGGREVEGGAVVEVDRGGGAGAHMCVHVCVHVCVRVLCVWENQKKNVSFARYPEAPMQVSGVCTKGSPMLTSVSKPARRVATSDGSWTS